MTEKSGVENSSSITYDGKNLPAMGAGRSIWVMSFNMIHRNSGIRFAAEDSEVVALRIVWFVDPGVAVACAVEIASSFHSF